MKEEEEDKVGSSRGGGEGEDWWLQLGIGVGNSSSDTMEADRALDLSLNRPFDPPLSTAAATISSVYAAAVAALGSIFPMQPRTHQSYHRNMTLNGEEDEEERNQKFGRTKEQEEYDQKTLP